ncbi:MAG: BACON domain-containing protein, partial [Planctomycetes bacterium]|nr:BACON domain-containing protein [Planctomycetota bacterium]
VISFFKWIGEPYQFKGTNRETAAKQFFDIIKNKARQPISTVFTPKSIENFVGIYNTTTWLVDLNWSDKIWQDLNFTWPDWGDYQEFVIYRGYDEDFECNSASEIARTTSYTYTDNGFIRNAFVYYKVAAVNVNGEVGAIQMAVVPIPSGTPTPILSVSRDSLNFVAIANSGLPPVQAFRISNTGTGALNWTLTTDAAWITCDPTSGGNGAEVSAAVDSSGLSIGSYSANITITDPQAVDSPKTIAVNLTVKSAGQDEDPFGQFSTPDDDSTVYSSIPVTGWVLDDVGIEAV